jgi:hypothetical protein
MNNAEFMRKLAAAHRGQLNKIGERLARERKDCVEFMRARLIALNPDAATPEEKAQVARCPHCARLLKQLQDRLSHPSNRPISDLPQDNSVQLSAD